MARYLWLCLAAAYFWLPEGDSAPARGFWDDRYKTNYVSDTSNRLYNTYDNGFKTEKKHHKKEKDSKSLALNKLGYGDHDWFYVDQDDTPHLALKKKHNKPLDKKDYFKKEEKDPWYFDSDDEDNTDGFEFSGDGHVSKKKTLWNDIIHDENRLDRLRDELADAQDDVKLLKHRVERVGDRLDEEWIRYAI